MIDAIMNEEDDDSFASHGGLASESSTRNRGDVGPTIPDSIAIRECLDNYPAESNSCTNSPFHCHKLATKRSLFVSGSWADGDSSEATRVEEQLRAVTQLADRIASLVCSIPANNPCFEGFTTSDELTRAAGSAH
jgi:hypothetical protein